MGEVESDKVLPHYWGETPAEEYYKEQRIKSTEFYYTAPSGLTLFTKSWQPIKSGPPRGIICMIHGYGNDISWTFQATPIFLAQNGFACFALDLHGHGRSQGLKAYVPNVDLVVDDCLSFFNHISTQDPIFQSPKKFLFGESNFPDPITRRIKIMILTTHPDPYNFGIGYPFTRRVSGRVGYTHYPLPIFIPLDFGRHSILRVCFCIYIPSYPLPFFTFASSSPPQLPKPAMMNPDYRAPMILPNQHMEEEQEEEQDEDPYAHCRVGANSFLGIDCLGRYCIQIGGPSFAQFEGIVVKPYKRSHGLHQFMVTKPEYDVDDTVDIVYVGTIMVQNGYAYTSGKVVLWEAPPICRYILTFPPFAFRIPRKIPAGVTPEDHHEQLRKQQEDELRKFLIEVKWFDLTLPRVLDFRFPRVPSDYPTCSNCGAELSPRDEEELPDRCCSNCGVESLQLEFTLDAEPEGYAKTWFQVKEMDHAWDLEQAMQAKQPLEMLIFPVKCLLGSIRLSADGTSILPHSPSKFPVK